MEMVTIYNEGRSQSVPIVMLGRYLGYGWTTTPPTPVTAPPPGVPTTGPTGTALTTLQQNWPSVTFNQILTMYTARILPYNEALALLTQSGRTTLSAAGGVVPMPTMGPYEAAQFLTLNAPEAIPTPLAMQGNEIPQSLLGVSDNLHAWLKDWAAANGFDDPDSMATDVLQYYWGTMKNSVFSTVLEFGIPGGETGYGYSFSPKQIEALIAAGKQYLTDTWLQGQTSPSSGYGPSGGGSGGLSAASFDKKALADQIEGAWRLYLRSKPNRSSMQMAEEYIAQVLRNPRQALDFTTWVKSRMQEDPSWNLIFKNKPDGVSPEQYMQNYAQAITSVIGETPGVDETIRAAATLGSTNEDLAGRLRLHENVQRTTGFMGSVESKYRSLRDVLGAM